MLLDGMSEQDLSFVANLESMSCRIRMYDAINRKLVAVGDLLPWPVVFVMLRYHHKHAFERASPPLYKTFLEDIQDMENRFKWRAALQGDRGDAQAMNMKHKMYRVANYRGFVAPALKGCLDELRGKLLHGFKLARRRRARGDINAAVKWTREFLAREDLQLVPYDNSSRTTRRAGAASSDGRTSRRSKKRCLEVPATRRSTQT